MDFSTALTTIFVNSNITIVNMASHIGYDSSYISKWKSGKSMPSIKNSERLTDQISEYVFSNCSKTEISRIFKGLHESQPASREEGEDRLSRLLNNCLLKQIGSKSLTHEHTERENAGKCSILPAGMFSVDYLKDEMNASGDECLRNMDVILAVEPRVFNDYFVDLWRDSFFVSDSDYGYRKISVLWSKKKSTGDLDLFKMIIRLLSCYKYAELNFFEVPRYQLRNVIAANRKYVLAINTEIDSGLGSVILSTDAELAERTYASKLSHCRMNYNAIAIQPHHEYIAFRHDIDMGLYGRMRLFLSVMYTIYMDNETLELFVQECGASDEWIAYQHESSIRDKTALIYKSALADYAHNGTIMFDYKMTKVSPELRKRHLSLLLDRMRENEHLKIILLDDINPVIPSENNAFSFIINDKRAYAIRRGATPEDSLIYRFRSSNLISCFADVFDDLLTECMVFIEYCAFEDEVCEYIQTLIDTIQ